MNNSSATNRFSKISVCIDIQKLERESLKFFYMGLVIGMFILLFAGQSISYRKIELTETRETEERHITVDLITLPPSVANPYQNWKRTFTPRTYIGKTFRIVTPNGTFFFKLPDITVEIPPDMKIPDIEQAKQYALETQAGFLDTLLAKLQSVHPDIESFYKYRDLTITREPEDRFSLQEELITLEDIDALGMYKAFIIQDPSDKQNIRGFFHIPRYFTEMRLFVTMNGFPRESFNLAESVNGLSEAFNYYTGLELIVDNPTSLLSPDIIDYPVVYLTTDSIEAIDISEFKSRIFGDYLRNGGLAVIDNGAPWHEWSQAKASLLNLLLNAFDNNFELQRIPPNHPLYYCFFEFDSSLPEGGENWPIPDVMWKADETVKYVPDWGELLHDPQLDKLRLQLSEYPPSLWGVWAGERLVAIYSDKGYGHLWQAGIIYNKSRDFNSGSNEKYNFNPQLKLGVNMLVYALIQEGGIARQLVDYSAQQK
ncbi:DUF4159 domain-containing protein [Candidatus Latescibacterota bacterium]